MTSREAYINLTVKNKGLKAVKCIEYDSRYVFFVVPEKIKNTDVSKRLDCTMSVDKKKGKVRDFKPFHISLDEYNRGKEVTDFK